MSAISSLFGKTIRGMNARDRTATTDALNRLRFALEMMPRDKAYELDHSSIRADVLRELYDSFWGPFSHYFLPPNMPHLPSNFLLSSVQQLAPPVTEPNQPASGRSCARILAKGECCYRCKDCAIDDSFVLCSRCFHATDHQGHTVTFYLLQQPGDCCYCGDPEVWRVPPKCPYHPFEKEPPPPPPGLGTRALDPWQMKQSARTHLPIDLRDAMSRTIAYAMDFVLDTLDYSPDETLLPENANELRIQPTADPVLKELFMIIVWNDEKHSFDEVSTMIMDATSCSRDDALRMTNTLEEQGREVVLTYRDTDKLLQVAHLIGNIDIGVTVRRAYDTFREEMTAVIIEWILDLMSCRVVGDAMLLRELVAEQLLQPRKKDSSMLAANLETSKIYADITNPTRVDWLFLYHTRLWKRPRLNLKQIYAAIFAVSHEHKLALADHFASVYHRLIDSYLLTDREAETSIKFFAIQVFTMPSIAVHCVRQHKIVTRIFDMITAFFTNQIANKRIIYPPQQNAEVDVDSMPFKSKRFMPIFSDLRYISNCKPVQQLLVRTPSYIQHFARVCQMFMGINANKRVASNHIEYETDAWISVFNVTLSLSRVVMVYGEAYTHATTSELANAILIVMHHILLLCTIIETRPEQDKYGCIQFHTVPFGGASYTIVDFSVLTGWVSFHHALHWLLAELFKHVDLLTQEKLHDFGASSLRDVIRRQASEKAFLTVIDFPLRVVAMIAQIRQGLWVRNGFAIRGQLMHYRELMLRELCYDQDLFILQTAFVVLDPDIVFVSMMDRFELRDWFSGSTEHHAYEGPSLLAMVEEFLYVVIVCVSETAAATKLSVPSAVRREIIHALASGPCSFTDLCKKVSERMVDDICFEKVLLEVSAFKSPDGPNDSGTYELKDECFDEVNPFFYHYIRNKREEVESILKARLRKKTGDSDPVIVPKPIVIESGPFAALPGVMTSDVLVQIIFYSIHNVLVETEKAGAAPPSADAILDQALYLVMFGLVQHPEGFAPFVASRKFEGGVTVWHVLAALIRTAMFKSHRSRLEWSLDRCGDALPTEVRQAREEARLAETRDTVDVDAAKKKAAQARKDAIMKQFAAQHQSLLEQLDDEGDMDDDGDHATEKPETYGTCIVCQEDLDNSRPFAALGFAQPSRFMRRALDNTHSSLHPPSHFVNVTHDRHSQKAATFPPVDQFTGSEPSLSFNGFPPSHTKFGLHVSECGHMMHLECFAVYNISIRQRHRSQVQRNHPENIQRKEFLCPLCKNLGNVILPANVPEARMGPEQGFSEWIRAMGISLLRALPERGMDPLQYKNGSGEFVFWSAQDSAYQVLTRHDTEADPTHKMLDTLMHTARSISMQSPHLRDRVEPEVGERGAGMYLPEELCAYTLGCMEIAQRGVASTASVTEISESSTRLLRGLVASLTKMASFHFKDRPDGGRPAIRQAIMKRLLPEWRREPAVHRPFLLRDPTTILFETAAVAPEILRYVVVLAYYASVARTALRLVSHLGKPSHQDVLINGDVDFTGLFGDIRIFVTSVARHSPTLDHTAQVVMNSIGQEAFNRFVYAHTLPFLRRAAMLVKAIIPSALRPVTSSKAGEYSQLMESLSIPLVSQLAGQEALQNVLAGWCAHFGYAYSPAPLDHSISLEYPGTYSLVQLPAALDTLFVQEKTMVCPRCKTVPLDVAVCLICGTICCFQSHCCKDAESRDRGECNMHTRECGGVIGLYFLIKRCALLYLYAGNGSFAHAPYLDVHGEIDFSMRRGRRQYLHPLRMEEIRRAWLNHGIPSFVARKLDAMIDSGGWETF